jgi:hypothetical protein
MHEPTGGVILSGASSSAAADGLAESKDPFVTDAAWEAIMKTRLLKQFTAVLLGALLYYFVLMPHLPARAQHQPFRLDWGLLVLVWICLSIYGLIELIARRRKS